MVSRIQNRNTGYSENLFSHNHKTENNAANSIYGATALKLDESYELQEEQHSSSISEFENNLENNEMIGMTSEEEQNLDNIPSGVSIESASYIEENTKINEGINKNDETEYTPKLFSEEPNHQSEDYHFEKDNQNNENTEQLFDQDINEEEDFEIPAFLRKQKF